MLLKAASQAVKSKPKFKH